MYQTKALSVWWGRPSGNPFSESLLLLRILFCLNIFYICFDVHQFQGPQALCGCVAAACGASAPSKKHAPGFLSTYIVNFVDFHGFEPPLDFFSKSGQSGQMTMPARRASKFSAKRRAVLLHIIFQSLIYSVIPGIIEPWPECQPWLRSLGYKTANPPPTPSDSTCPSPPPRSKGGAFIIPSRVLGRLN